MKPVKQIQVVIISIALYQLATKRNTRVVIDEKRSILTVTLASKTTVRVSIFIETVSQIFYLPGRSISLHYAWAEIVLFLSRCSNKKSSTVLFCLQFRLSLSHSDNFLCQGPAISDGDFCGITAEARAS